MKLHSYNSIFSGIYKRKDILQDMKTTPKGGKLRNKNDLTYVCEVDTEYVAKGHQKRIGLTVQIRGYNDKIDDTKVYDLWDIPVKSLNKKLPLDYDDCFLYHLFQSTNIKYYDPIYPNGTPIFAGTNELKDQIKHTCTKEEYIKSPTLCILYVAHFATAEYFTVVRDGSITQRNLEYAINNHFTN